jgi:hypothetical protein
VLQRREGTSVARRVAPRLGTTLGPTHNGGGVVRWPSDGDRRRGNMGGVAWLTGSVSGSGGEDKRSAPLL